MSGKIFKIGPALRFWDCDISGTAYFPAYLDILNGVNEEFWAKRRQSTRNQIWMKILHVAIIYQLLE